MKFVLKTKPIKRIRFVVMLFIITLIFALLNWLRLQLSANLLIEEHLAFKSIISLLYALSITPVFYLRVADIHKKWKVVWLAPLWVSYLLSLENYFLVEKLIGIQLDPISIASISANIVTAIVFIYLAFARSAETKEH